MPPFFNGDSNYQETIERIIELERSRLTRIETNLSAEQLKLDSLRDLRGQSEELDSILTQLSGINSAFRDKTGLSSEPESLSVSVQTNDRRVQDGEYAVEVVQTAKNHIIASKPIRSQDGAAGLTIPAGDITFGLGETSYVFTFSGGSPQAFHAALVEDDTLSEVLRVDFLERRANEYILILAAREPGVSNRIRVEKDPKGIARALGLFMNNPPVQLPVVEKEAFFESATADGFLKQEKGGQNLVAVPPQGSLRFDLNKSVDFSTIRNLNFFFYKEDFIPPVAAESSLIDATSTENTDTQSVAADTTDATPTESPATDTNIADAPSTGNSDAQSVAADTADATTTENPAADTNIADATSTENTDTQSVAAETVTTQDTAVENAETEEPPVLTAVLEYSSNGETTRRRALLKTSDIFLNLALVDPYSLSLPAEAEITLHSLTFTNASSDDSYLYSPPLLEKTRENRDPMIPVKTLQPAEDAIVKYQGLELERPSNQVDDIIPGVTLQLRQPSTQPIQVEIERDTENLLIEIKELIAAYNDLIEILNIYLAQNEESLGNPELNETFTERVAVFRSDFQLSQVKASLRSLITQAYPNEDVNAPVFFSQIGFETVFIPQSPFHINSDKINFNERLFVSSLDTYEGTLTNLFSYDTNGDSLPDTGLLIGLENVLERLQGRQGGFIGIRETTLTRSVESFQDQFDEEEQRLADRRSELEEDFAEVQAIQAQQESTSNWLNSLQNGN